MDISGRQVWQQGSGDTDRNYSKFCLDWNVILNGPGDAGKWPDCKEPLLADGWSSKKISDLRRFSEDMKAGDIVVLRLGTKLVVAVGEIIGKYEYREEFGDIDGWDIQHVRRVRWLWSPPNSPKDFGTYALKQGDTTQLLNDGVVKDWLKKLVILKSAHSKPIVDLPRYDHSSSVVGIKSLGDGLYDEGLPWRDIQNIVNTIEDLTRIAKWYKKESPPSEYETVAYLAIPLLRSLGWSTQKMAVEWKNLDIALFNRPQRTDENLSVAVEVKKIGSSYFKAEDQVINYASSRPNCRRAIVTDGIRYGVYTKEKKGYELKSYLSLLRIAREYPILKCNGALSAIATMSPDWH